MNLNKNTLSDFLKTTFPGSKVKFIEEGWGSIAFVVDDNIVRFPKEGIGDYEKEKLLTNYVREYVDVSLPKIQIFENSLYKYAMHKMLEGNSWNVENICSLPANRKELFIKDCATFLAKIHSIDISAIKKLSPTLEYKPAENIPFEGVEPYICHSFSNDDLSRLKRQYESAYKEEIEDIVFSHRDFSGSNSLIDDNYKLTGVFDWGNSNLSERAYEFHRLYNPDYIGFLEQLLNEYSKLSNATVNIDRVKNISLMDTITSAYWVNVCEDMAKMKDKEMKWIIKKLRWFL